MDGRGVPRRPMRRPQNAPDARARPPRRRMPCACPSAGGRRRARERRHRLGNLAPVSSGPVNNRPGGSAGSALDPRLLADLAGKAPPCRSAVCFGSTAAPIRAIATHHAAVRRRTERLGLQVGAASRGQDRTAHRPGRAGSASARPQARIDGDSFGDRRRRRVPTAAAPNAAPPGHRPPAIRPLRRSLDR